MPTINPKVSAYIPQHIFDRFKQFYEEKEISMSQAVAVIFADYFQVDYQVNQRSSLIGGVSLVRVEALEEQVRSLAPIESNLPSELSSKLLNLENLVVQIESRLSNLEANHNSEPLNRLPKESTEALPEIVGQQDDSVKQLNMLDSVDRLPLGDSSPTNVQHSDNDLSIHEPQVDQKSNPLSNFLLNIKQLSLRINFNSGSITNAKVKYKNNIEEFSSWLGDRDPDKIRWVEADIKGRTKYYKPVNDTPNNLLSRLHDWIKSNL